MLLGPGGYPRPISRCARPKRVFRFSGRPILRPPGDGPPRLPALGEALGRPPKAFCQKLPEPGVPFYFSPQGRNPFQSCSFGAHPGKDNSNSRSVFSGTGPSPCRWRPLATPPKKDRQILKMLFSWFQPFPQISNNDIRPNPPITKPENLLTQRNLF